MRKSSIAIAALGLATAITVAACSSSGEPSTSPSGGSAGSGGAPGGADVGVILADTTSSGRYVGFNAPLLSKALTAAGLEADVQNAGGSTTKFSSVARSMIGNGIKVLIIDSVDLTSGAAVEPTAAAAGVKVIDYDRVNLGGSAHYYVSFDNEKVGQLQGQTLVDCLTAAGVSNPEIIEMDGGIESDNNAVLLKKGAQSVLKPL